MVIICNFLVTRMKHLNIQMLDPSHKDSFSRFVKEKQNLYSQGEVVFIIRQFQKRLAYLI